MKTSIALLIVLLAVASAEDPCQPGHFLHKKECKKCPKGTFQPKSGKKACRPCPDGKVAMEAGSTKCVSCGKNMVPSEFKHKCFCIQGAERVKGKCILCKPGSYFYATGKNKGFCELCRKGEFQSKAGQLSCLPCPTGSTSASGAKKCKEDCEEDFFLSDDGECVTCKAGQYYDGYSCSKCDANTFKAKPGLGPCLPCPKHFHSRRGAKKCFVCPEGEALMKKGVCGKCPAGSHFNSYKRKCDLCSQGTFMPHKNVKTSCFTCAGNKFSMKGATKCISCPKHEHLFKDGSCGTCPSGTYYARYKFKCIACEVNQFTRGKMDYCESCPRLTYSYPMAETCFECPKGQALIVKKKKCATCPAGKYYDRYSAKCTQCYEGSIKRSPGIGDCTSCPGTMTSNEDNTECIPH